jgi:integrase
MRFALRAIDLHFHDLRHKAASRRLEAGSPLHTVRDMAGHATIDQTDTCANRDGSKSEKSEHPTNRNAEQKELPQVTVN